MTVPPLETDTALPDTVARSWVEHLPPAIRPYARLARFDRPIGTWLLFWPCAWGLALAGGLPSHSGVLLLLGIGAVAMRGAGCVFNDIIDRDLDAQVERTRDRPLASGRVSVRAAAAWLAALSLVGLAVLMQLPPLAQVVALASLALVAAYPFMKRITWWPQAWLGLTFNWGALVGYAAVGGGDVAPALWLYAGGLFWTLGYDTIYALQDIDDDALAGIKSSARRLSTRVRPAIGIFYAAALVCWAAAILTDGASVAAFALVPAAVHFVWQVGTLDPANPANALRLFRSNAVVGLLLFVTFALAG